MSESILERFGMTQLKKRHARRRSADVADGDVHLLNADERRALRRLERLTLLRAGLIGAASASIAAAVEVALIDRQDDVVFYWAVLGSVSAVCAVAEIVLLSLDALRAAHEQALIAGAVTDDDAARDEAFRVLARAALEIPNPRESGLSIDPLRETPKAWLIAAALVYKLKVSATNIILKQLLRRSMGRAALRATIVPFVAVPVTAAWNMIVCHQVLRELRVRVLGPAAVADVVARVMPPAMPLSPALQTTLLRAVGACVVRSADIHPNLLALLLVLMKRTGLSALPDDVDNSARFVEAFRALPRAEQAIVAPILRTAAIIDGRARGNERRLLREAGAEAGVDDALMAFVKGLPIPVGAAVARTLAVPFAFIVAGDVSDERAPPAQGDEVG